LTPGAPWQIRIDQALRDKIRPEAPDGWLPLDAAAQALGVARQTVLHKVQRGQLHAVHVNRGRRKGLRIQVKPDQAGLFETADRRHAQCYTARGGPRKTTLFLAATKSSVPRWAMVSRLRPRAWSKSNSSNDFREGNRAARMRPSPPWDSRADTPL